MTSKRVFFLHPNEPMLVLVLLLLACGARLWIAMSDRQEMGDVRLQEHMASVLAGNCRYDLEHQCKSPREFDHADQHKPSFYIVFVDQQESCETPSVVPNPFLSINYYDSFQSCPWEGMKHINLMADKEKQEKVVQQVLDRTILNIANNVLFLQRGNMKNRDSFRKHTYTRDGIPWQLGSTFLSDHESRCHVLDVFLRSIITFLVGESNVEHRGDAEFNPPADSGSSTAQLLVYPDEVILPIGVFTFDEVLTMLKSSALHFADERPLEKDFLNQLNHVLEANLPSMERSQPQTPEGSATFNELPPLPFVRDGKEMSMCLHQLYHDGSLISQTCGSTIQMASQKMNELEFLLDFPIAGTTKWIYIFLALVALSKLMDQLGQGETKVQRSRRQFVQTMEDPLLRKGIENQAVKELGEESAAKFMMELEDRAKSYASAENQTDLEWKKQESLQEAWRQRLVFAKAVRVVCFILLVFSTILLVVDKAQVGTVLEGVAVVLSSLLSTYWCLPQSPGAQSNKRSSLEEPLLT